MKKCPKCENTEIRKETGRMEGAYGGGGLFKVIIRYICIDCGHKWKKLWGRVWTTPKCPNCGSENVVMRGYPP